MVKSFSLVLDDDGIVMAHAIDCPEVEKAREAGKPILTLLDCDNPLSSAPGRPYKRHSCLDESTTERNKS